MDQNLSDQARQRLAALKGRRLGVVGLGREGIDLARFLARQGVRVVASDMAPASSLDLHALEGLPIEYLLGKQEGADLLGCVEIFVSPGVPRSAPIVAEAAHAGIPLSSATSLFFELCPGSILGITGSSGKTTTTALVGQILCSSGFDVLVGGNIGVPLLGRLEETTPRTWCVLELSSFQLEDMVRSPRVAVVLNITPNHLDRHASLEEYIQAKSTILRFQSQDDLAVLNADDPVVCSLAHESHTVAFSLCRRVSGGWLSGDELVVGGNIPQVPASKAPAPASGGPLPGQRLLLRKEIPLRGLHNVANVLAAATATLTLGCDIQAIAAAIRAFRPVPHRLEVVGQFDGVTYVNDSIATSPERSIAALNAFEEPIVLIAGGRDKHLPMEDWARLIGRRVRAVVLVGEAAAKIDAALEAVGAKTPKVMASRFGEAVAAARTFAQPGDIVLLSPGCTSFDEFRDFEDRGEAFRQAVLENLKRSHSEC